MSMANGHFPKTAREAAAIYLGRGASPIPVPFKSKRPVLEGWPELRPAPNDLDGLFPAGAACNVGLLVGDASNGILDADIDCLEALEAAPLLLPATGWISGRCGKPRSHRWYRSKTLPAPATSPFKDVDGSMLVELRSSGAQTLAPPSIHTSGEPIIWHEFNELAELPLDEIQTAVRTLAAAAILARHWPTKGSRHDARLALAGGLARGGWPVEKIDQFVEAVRIAAGNEDAADAQRVGADTIKRLAAGKDAKGWPTLAGLLDRGADVVAKAREWLGLNRDPSPEPWPDLVPLNDVPTVPPFPLDVLPASLRQFVEAGAAAMPCPVDYLAVPTLVMAGGAIGASRALAVKEGHIQRAALYAAVIGPPGSAKTPSMNLTVEPAHEVEERLHAAWEEKMEQYQADVDAYDAASKEWKKSREGDQPKKPERPTLTRLTVNDATAESLVPILKENQRGVVLVRDELVAWVQAMNCYREGGKGADQQFWLSAWSGATVCVDRKKTHDLGPLRVRNPFVAVVGGLVPDKLATLRGDRFRQRAEQDGFLDRVLLSYPPEPPTAAETWAEIPEPTINQYRELMDRLRTLAMVPIQEAGLTKGWRPFVVKLSASGRQAWQAFTVAHAAERNADDFPPHLAGPWSKLRGYCVRLGLIVHYLRWAAGEAPDDDVDGESMSRAARLVEYFKGHAKRVYAVMDADTRVAAARRLLQWLGRERLPQFTRRDAYREMRGVCKAVEEIDPILNLLEGHGHIRPIHGDGVQRPGRKPSPVYEVHPSVLGHNGHNGQNRAKPARGDGPNPNCVHSGHSVQGSESEIENEWDGGDDEGGRDFEDGDGGPDDRKPFPFKGTGGAVPNNNVEDPDYPTDDDQDDSDSPQTNAHNSRNPQNRPADGNSVQNVHSVQGVEEDSQTLQESENEEGHFENLHLEPGHNGRIGHNSAMNTSAPEYRLVNDRAGLDLVQWSLDGAGRVALDLETTGLDARKDAVRLLSVSMDSPEGGRSTFLVDCFAINPAPLFSALTRSTLIGHNLAFDLAFLGRMGFVPGNVTDTLNAARLLAAGTRAPCGLADVAAREVGITLDKSEQKGNWAGALTQEQLRYAALDVAVLAPLLESLDAKIRGAGLERVAEIENRCLPAVVWLAGNGVAIDRQAWSKLATEAKAEVIALEEQLNAQVPGQAGLFGKVSEINWSSPLQVKKALAEAGVEVESTDDAALAAVDHPLAALIRQHRAATKLATTYGAGWLKFLAADGRVYPGWVQLGSDSGRMSCGKPNVQQLPRDKRYRQCVVAPPERILIKADYSQIELRLAAKIADESRMLDAYMRGEDLHTQTARLVLGKEDVNKQDRQIAKVVNFGLLYGMGAAKLRTYARTDYGVELTEAQAAEYRSAFFRAYPGLARWHRRVGDAGAPETRTLAGRRRLFPEPRFSDQLATPVSGTGADGLKLALALLWERRDDCPDAFPVLAVHDEIVVEAPADQAEQAAAWLKTAMLDGMRELADPVPVEVEVTTGRTWGG